MNNPATLLARTGVSLSPRALAIARSDSIFERFLGWLARPNWLRAIRLGEAQAGICGIAELYADQISECCLDRNSALEVSLTARRFAHYRLRGLSSYDQISREVRQTSMLPPAFPDPRDLLQSFAPSTCHQFLSSLQAFIEREPVHRSGDSGSQGARGSREDVDRPFEKWESAKIPPEWETTSFACHDVLRPIAMRLLRDGLAGHDVANSDAPHLLVDQLQICYGFGWADALELLVAPDGSAPVIISECPGWIDRQRGELVRIVGNGFFPSGRRYALGTYRLPLLPHVRLLLDQCVDQGFYGSLNGAFGAGGVFHDAYRRRLHIIIGEWQPRMRFRTKSLQASFEAAALYDRGIVAAELSLMRGKSVYASETEANYISILASEIVEKWTRIYGQLYQWATGCEVQPVFPQCAGQSHLLGRPSALSLAAYIELVRAMVARAQCWNELMVCIAALLQALGGRNGIHRNPASLYRAYPCAHLQFADKHREGELVGLREIPVVDPVRELVDVAIEIVGVDGDFLPYIDGGAVVTSSEVSDRSLFAWLASNESSSLGRTAFYNELRGRGVGDVLRSYLMGHGDRDVLRSLSLPLTGARLYSEAASVLEPILLQCRFPEAVADLRTAAARFTRPEIPPEWLHHRDAYEVWSVDAARPTPLTELEDRCATWIYQGLQTGLNLPAEPWASAVLLSLEAGVPFSFFVSNRSYFAFGSIAFPQGREEALLVALMEQADVGHLSPFLIRLPRNCASLSHIRRRFERRCRDGHTTPEQALNYALFGDKSHASSAVARYVNRLLIRGRAPRHLCNLGGKDAVQLLDRISSRLATHLHLHSVAAAFRGVIPGLNHIEMRFVLAEIYGEEGRELRNLAGERWSEWVPVSFRRKVVNRELPQTYALWIQSQREHISDFWLNSIRRRANPILSLHALFVRHRFAPAISRFKSVLEVAGYEPNECNALAKAAYHYFRQRGNLAVSEPEPIINLDKLPCELVWGKVNLGLRLGKVIDEERTLIEKQTIDHARLCAHSGLRISEAVALRPAEVINSFSGSWVYVYDGKTRAARRAVCLERIGAGKLELTLGDYRRVEMREHNTPGARTKRLRRLIDRLFAINPHGFRRSSAWRALRWHLNRWNQGGSLLATLAALARCYGHRSIVTTLHDYIGTLLATLDEVGVDARKHYLQPLPERQFAHSRKALRDLYSGRTLARHEIMMAIKRCAAQPGSGGLIGMCWIGAQSDGAVHATWCDDQLGLPVWVEVLPGFPELPEFWLAITKIRQIAEQRHLPILILVPRMVIRDKRDRLAAALGDDCFAGLA